MACCLNLREQCFSWASKLFAGRTDECCSVVDGRACEFEAADSAAKKPSQQNAVPEVQEAAGGRAGSSAACKEEEEEEGDEDEEEEEEEDQDGGEEKASLRDILASLSRTFSHWAVDWQHASEIFAEKQIETVEDCVKLETMDDWDDFKSVRGIGAIRGVLGQLLEEHPCFQAARDGDLERMVQLVRRRGGRDAVCFDGDSPLHLAAKGGHEDIVRFCKAVHSARASVAKVKAGGQQKSMPPREGTKTDALSVVRSWSWRQAKRRHI